MSQSILLISENSGHLVTVCDDLCRNKMEVLQLESISEVKAGLTLHSPAFLLLDLDTTGSMTFLSEISNGFYQPRPFVLVCTNSCNGRARAHVLRLGADICIDKPINAEEVLAVIHAVYRREQWVVRHGRNRRLSRIEYKDIKIDPFLRCVTMKGNSISLTEKEFDILCLLAQHHGKVLTKKEIYQTVWNADLESDASAVTDHISSIRRKLGLSSKSNDYIQTVFRIGYRFERINDGRGASQL